MFRAALEEALTAADADQRIGPLLAAAGLQLRFVFTDAGLVLDISSGDGSERNLGWSFDGDPGRPPELELEMDAEVANRYLQGSESLAIAIAHRKVRCQGGSRSALRFLPATRLICEPYRRIVHERYPELIAG